MYIKVAAISIYQLLWDPCIDGCYRVYSVHLFKGGKCCCSLPLVVSKRGNKGITDKTENMKDPES